MPSAPSLYGAQVRTEVDFAKEFYGYFYGSYLGTKNVPQVIQATWAFLGAVDKNYVVKFLKKVGARLFHVFICT